MQKKEYLLKILTQLESVRELAPWLKILVEWGDLSDDFLDSLMGTVELWIRSTNSEVARSKIKKWLDALERMRQIEKQSSLRDEKELAWLDDLINNF